MPGGREKRPPAFGGPDEGAQRVAARVGIGLRDCHYRLHRRLHGRRTLPPGKDPSCDRSPAGRPSLPARENPPAPGGSFAQTMVRTSRHSRQTPLSCFRPASPRRYPTSSGWPAPVAPFRHPLVPPRNRAPAAAAAGIFQSTASGWTKWEAVGWACPQGFRQREASGVARPSRRTQAGQRGRDVSCPAPCQNRRADETRFFACDAFVTSFGPLGETLSTEDAPPGPFPCMNQINGPGGPFCLVPLSNLQPDRSGPRDASITL